MLDDLILEVKWLTFDIITKNLLIAIELTGSEEVICPLKISLEIDLYNWNANKSIQFCNYYLIVTEILFGVQLVTQL